VAETVAKAEAAAEAETVAETAAMAGGGREEDRELLLRRKTPADRLNRV